MDESKNKITMAQFKSIINMYSPCMDDFLYVYNVNEDYYFISPSSLDRFMIPANRFHHVMENLKSFVFPEDYPLLMEELKQVAKGEKNVHNLQYRWLDKNGKAVWIDCRGIVLYDEEGKPEFLIGCINEIGKKPKADNVSGLLGETSLHYEIGQNNHKRMKGFLLRVGIDNFKEINENNSMDYGDMILRRTAECIASVILPGQKLYRIVSDEFVVLDTTGRTVEAAMQIYQRIRWKISLFIEENCYEVFYTVSGGIVDFDDIKHQTYYNLMMLSEYALNEAKSNGKNRCHVYALKDYQAFLRRKELIQIVRQSVLNDFKGFEAYYQPIVNIKENRLYSAETLLRFYTDEIGMVSPVELIPLLEESGLIIPVGKWIIHQAMEHCSRVQKDIPDFKVSVNLSYIQVLKSNVLEEILAAEKQYKLKPESIIIELTESGFLEENTNLANFCDGLKEYGIPLALDDFGTGYSNFHYLCNLNPQVIKIDRSFTLKALNNDHEYVLLRHMVEMVHSIGLRICIEGIETATELNKISQINPDLIQGYYFGKPCPAQKFMDTIVEQWKNEDRREEKKTS